MNLPNKLTLARIIMTPFFLWALLAEWWITAAVIFSAASLTDLFDGKIARSRGLVTDFGKFVDPLADKALTTAAFLGFLQKQMCPGIAWIVFIVLLREFAVSGLRLICVQSGKVVAANIWGKAKTVSQMAAIIATLVLCRLTLAFPEADGAISVIIAVMLWISAALTVISGAVYLYQNRKFINTAK